MSSAWTGLISVDAWERAFLDEMPANNEGMEATRLLSHDATADIVSDVLDTLSVAIVGIAFPESMHGDAIYVNVSRFPGGTAVGRRTDDFDHGLCFVLPDATYEEIAKAAREAIYEGQEGAGWAEYEEGEDAPAAEHGNPAQWFGFEKLRAAWNRQKSAKRTATRSKRAGHVRTTRQPTGRARKVKRAVLPERKTATRKGAKIKLVARKVATRKVVARRAKKE